MGVSPNKWGPYFWGALHLACLTGTATPEFVYSYPSLLPCPSCSSHFAELLKENPFPQTDDPIIMFEWSVHVHNMVNARIGKPIISVDQALLDWSSEKTAPTREFDFKIPFIIAFVIIILMLIKM